MEEISRILPRVLGCRLPWAEEHVVKILQPLWPQAVGEAIARNTRVVAFWNGTLTIATGCPSWQSQLSQMEGALCAQINNFLGAKRVQRVRVRQQPETSLPAALPARASAAARKSDAAVQGGPQPIAELEMPSGSIALNQELAEIVAASHRKYFARRPKDKA